MVSGSPRSACSMWLASAAMSRLDVVSRCCPSITSMASWLVTVDSGLNLIGSPLSFSSLTRGAFTAEPSATLPASTVTDEGELQLTVANNGYFPKTLHAPANTPLTLALLTDETTSCARDFVIPALDYYQLLPSSGRTTTEIPPQEAGSILRFTCSMGMYTGQIVFDQ